MAEAFNRVGQTLTTTSATQVYTAPAVAGTDRAIVLSVLLANVTGGIHSATVSIQDAAGSTVSTLLQSTPIPGNTSLEVIVNKQVLLSGDKVVVQAGTANAFSVTVSALEII